MVGDGDRVMVEITGSVKEKGMATRPVMLVGTTSRYIFLFRTDWQTVILPDEDVLRIAPVGTAPGLSTTRPRMIHHLYSTAAR